MFGDWAACFRTVFIYIPLFSIAVLPQTGCTFSHYTVKAYENAKKEKPYDVVIVPGIPYEGKKTSRVMKMRLYWAKHLYDNGYCKNIIFSGSAVYTPYIEGIIMRVMADSLGIPSDHTFAETEAEHSTENAYYSWRMAKELGFNKIALASDPFQSGFLKGFLRKYCPGMKSVPIMFEVLNIDEKELPEINPSSAKVENFISVRKKEGFFERLRYTLGKRVKDQDRLARRKRKVDQQAGG